MQTTQPSTLNSQLFADYHTHPQGHRVQRYTQELLQPWIDAARGRGITDFAFTDHDRYHAGIDFDELDRLREKNPDLKIRAGIELDNDPETSAAGRKWVQQNWERLDFVLGSVHYLSQPDQMFDSLPAGAQQFAGRNIDEIYSDYFRRVREIAATGLVDWAPPVHANCRVGGRNTGADSVPPSRDRIVDCRLAQTGERALSVRRNYFDHDEKGNSVHGCFRRALMGATRRKL